MAQTQMEQVLRDAIRELSYVQVAAKFGPDHSHYPQIIQKVMNHLDDLAEEINPAPVPDPVWDAEKVAQFAVWVKRECKWSYDWMENKWFWQEQVEIEGESSMWPKRWIIQLHECTTLELIQTFLNRPK